MTSVWTFYIDGFKGRAERYGSLQHEVYITWRNLGCHLNGVKQSFASIVLKAEKEA